MIGGRVLDGGALVALADGSLAVRAWIATAEKEGLTLYVPGAALAEARMMRPEAAGLLALLAAHPEVVVAADPDALTRREIDAVHERLDVFDPAAAWTVAVALARGWEVLTRDAERLRRLDREVAVFVLP